MMGRQGRWFASAGIVAMVAVALVGLAVPTAIGAADGRKALDDEQVCALLSDEEILRATGAEEIASRQAGPQFMLAAGCEWDLSAADGSVLRTLTIGAQRPGGRARFDAEAEVWKGLPHIAGIGEDAFSDISDTGWSAVTDDTYLALGYLAMGFGSTEGTPPGDVTRRALAWLAAARVASPAAAVDEPGPVCLLSLEELNEVTGLEFVTRVGGETNCTYDSDTTVAQPYSLDLSLRGRDPTGTVDDDLLVARLSPGQDVTVAGFPAWESEYVLSVDVGDRLFVVQPTFLFSSSAPAPSEVMVAIAALAVGRMSPELMTVAPTPMPVIDAALESRFPNVGGAPLNATTVAGSHLLAQIEADPVAAERFRALEEALAPMGLGLEAVSIGTADRALAGGFVTINAIRVVGADRSLLLGPVLDWLSAGRADLSRAERQIAGVNVVELVVPGADDSDIGARTRYAVVTDDVLWVLSVTHCELAGTEPSTPCARLGVDTGILEEIVAQLS
jgi:hypothetical protein